MSEGVYVMNFLGYTTFKRSSKHRADIKQTSSRPDRTPPQQKD